MSEQAEKDAAERRKLPRNAAMVPVDYSTVDEFFSEFTTNINEGGMFIGTDQPHAVDTLVTLQFRLPGGAEPCAVTGRVVWVRPEPDEEGPRGMGVEFEALEDAARSQINDLVRDLRTPA